jgi:HD-GYP domain-containing protein (c-di-GMP phosphodiesterase class II)
MGKAFPERSGYLEAVIKTAQYVAGLTAERDKWEQLGKVVVNFFGADVVAFAERRPDGRIAIPYCNLAEPAARDRLAAESTSMIAQVLESGFLVSEVVRLPEPYSAVFLPVALDSRNTAVMVVGHKTGQPLPRDLLNIYLAVAGMFETTLARIASEEALWRVNRALRTLGSCNLALVHAGTEEQLLGEICRIIVEVGGYHMAWAGLLAAGETEIFWPVSHAGWVKGEENWNAVTSARSGLYAFLTGEAIRSGKARVVQDVATEPGCEPCRELAEKLGIAAGVSFPLMKQSSVLGALTIYAAERHAFSEDELKLLYELAGDLAYGIVTLRTRTERERLEEERKRNLVKLEKSMEATVQAIAATIEMRDPYTAGHQRRVADLARHIAQDMSLPADEIHGIYLAATIHDIGKIHIPAEILSFPGRLGDIEYSLIKTHAQIGYDILKNVEFPWPVAQMVWQHHEHLDGSGYPRKLKGDEIMLGARILCVADVVEAMASYRPYRPGLGLETALKEITEYRGAKYDARVVDACLRVIREKGYFFEYK